MRLLLNIPAWLATALAVACTATVGVQAVGAGVAWSRGMLTRQKIVQYAGVVYGLEPFNLLPPSPAEEQKGQTKTREEILAERVNNTPRLVERVEAVTRTADEIRSVTLGLKRTREKYVVARDGFQSLLNQLETDTATRALREVQVTMEIVQPKQAKDILKSMLNGAADDPTDDVMKDVVDVVKALPDDKLKKILDEFKSDEDRKLLHRILVEIGQLDERTSQLSRATP